MKLCSVIYTGTQRYSFRRGEKAIVTGVKYLVISSAENRLCAEVTYQDGFTDYIPMSEWTEIGEITVGAY